MSNPAKDKDPDKAPAPANDNTAPPTPFSFTDAEKAGLWALTRLTDVPAEARALN